MALKRRNATAEPAHPLLAVPSYGAMALKRDTRVVPFIGVQLAVPSYGAMALKPPSIGSSSSTTALAVPSYGAMALKHRLRAIRLAAYQALAVPSYGAMALKHEFSNVVSFTSPACSPLLRGDGPETKVQTWPNTAASCACSPLLRGDGPETLATCGGTVNFPPLAVPSHGAMALKPADSVAGANVAEDLQSPPT